MHTLDTVQKMSQASKITPSTASNVPEFDRAANHYLELPNSVIDMSTTGTSADHTQTSTIFWDKTDLKSYIKVEEGTDIADEINSNIKPLSAVQSFLQSVSKEYAESLPGSMDQMSKIITSFHIGLAKAKYERSQEMSELRTEAGRIFSQERYGQCKNIYEERSSPNKALWRQISGKTEGIENASAPRIFSAITQTATAAQMGDEDLMAFVINSLITRGNKIAGQART